MIEDAELLRRYAEAHSEEAFAELVQRRIGLVYSVALRTTRDTHRAEDVTQAVFADLARKAASLRNRPVLAGWLYRSAHFAALGTVRAEQNRTAREQKAQAMHEIHNGSDPDPDWDQVRPVLDEVLNELSERERDAIVLRFFDGRPFAVIGAHLRLSEDTARKSVERALDKLHALLARRGIRSTTAALGAALAHQATAAAPAGLAAAVTGSALASTPVVTTPVASVLQIMSTSKIIAATAGLVVVLALGTSGYEVYASRIAEAAVGVASRENDSLLDKFRDLRRRAETADLATADLQKSIDAARAGKVAEQQRAAQTAAARRSALSAQVADGEAFTARHPEVRQAFIDFTRAEFTGMYAPLFRTLRLSPDQIERFKDLMVQGGRFGKYGGTDGQMIAVNTGTDPAQANAQLRALLGDDGFRQFREFDSSPWQMTTELAGALYNTSAPLTAAQGEQMLQILTDSKVATDWSPTRQLDWDAILPKARQVLSDVQLDALGFYQAQDRFSQALTQSRRTAQASGTQGGAAKPGK